MASQSFPSNYKEPLVEFPQQLRSKDTAADADAKTLHEQEERRLFYVSMTRAMDELYLCGKVPRGKNPIPTKYLRELVSEARLTLKDAITSRVLEPELIASIHAAAEPLPNVSHWTQLPPREDGHRHALSASAIQQYENCPLAYKLKYDWRLPEEPSAALQFGSAMHLALKAYFDGVRAGRPPDEETVIACFLDELSKAKIDEPLQRALYEKDGRDQLTALLRSELGRSRGEILETERRFKVEIGGAQVSGRFDRLDRVDGGEVEIVDYKTGKPKTQEDAEDSLQLSIYALAARSLGYTPSALVFINLQNGSPWNRGVLRSNCSMRRNGWPRWPPKLPRESLNLSPVPVAGGVRITASAPRRKHRSHSFCQARCKSQLARFQSVPPKAKGDACASPGSYGRRQLVLLGLLCSLLSLLCSLFCCHGFYSPFPFVMEHCDIHFIAIC